MVTKRVICPTCKATALFDSSNASRPFCSWRCQQGDLAAWASDNYKIAGSTVNSSAIEYPTDTQNDDQAVF